MKKLLLTLFTLIVISLFLGEVTSRLLYSLKVKLPFFYAAEDLIYPELFYVKRDYRHNRHKKPGVLLIGGSALQYVGRDRILEAACHGRMVFYNGAVKAHTTLDSLNKFSYLTRRGYRFDYVLFYHGINDVRANNIPPELFSDDYSHYYFYKSANSVFRNQNQILGFLIRYSALAYRLNQACLTMTTDKNNVLGMHSPPQRWLKYGSDIKTAKTFRRNLTRIIEIAEKTKTPLIVPVFAYHLAPGYSLEKFKARQLGYIQERGFPFFPNEMWGLTENVIKGMKTHNEVIKSLRDRFYLIDTAGISRGISNFNDLCHFSKKGRSEFARLVWEKIKEISVGMPKPGV